VVNLRGFFLLIGASLLLASCSREVFPPIKEGEALRKDCIHLLEQFPQGDIPKLHWPKSIEAMKPLRVTGEQDHVHILLRREPGKFTVGYDVFADTQSIPSTKGVWIQKTRFKGIYEFKLAY
jgi:hypothetical protein